MRARALIAAACALACASPARATLDGAWRALPAGLPGDSAGVALARMEAESRGRDASTAYALGQFHEARGEYRQAAAAFARAVARSGGDDREAARYALGLAWLGAGETARARDAFEAVSGSRSRERAFAILGLVAVEEAEGRPELAWQALERVDAGSAGEASPALLERRVTLGMRLHRFDEAAGARARLLRDWPRSIEAARVAAEPGTPTLAGAWRVQIGAFADRAHADALAAQAGRAGLPGPRVVARPASPGRPALWAVELGGFGSDAAARDAGARAERALGVAWQVLH